MASEEYVDAIKMMMEHQDRYFNWFLAILGIVLVFVGFVQWRFSTKQIEQLKEKTKQETIREIEESLGVSSLIDFKSDIQKKVEKIEKKNYEFGHSQMYYEFTKLNTEKKDFLWHIPNLMDVYKNNILSSFNDFNLFVSTVGNLIIVSHTQETKIIDINSPHIDKILKKMTDYESKFNKKSEKLERFQHEITYFRNEEKQKN